MRYLKNIDQVNYYIFKSVKKNWQRTIKITHGKAQVIPKSIMELFLL